MSILIAIDEQTCATAAIKFVAEHERKKDLHIKLINVIPLTAMSSYDLYWQSVPDEAFKAGKDLLEQTATQLKKNQQCANRLRSFRRLCRGCNY